MKPIPDYCEHMTIEDFVQCCKDGLFVNNDGSGYYATQTEMSDEQALPSILRHGIYNPDYTHVCWFNK